MPDVYVRTLRRAAEIVGSIKDLARKLGAPEEDVYLWIQRVKAVPLDVFLRAVDIVTEDSKRGK